MFYCVSALAAESSVQNSKEMETNYIFYTYALVLLVLEPESLPWLDRKFKNVY